MNKLRLLLDMVCIQFLAVSMFLTLLLHGDPPLVALLVPLAIAVPPLITVIQWAESKR